MVQSANSRAKRNAVLMSLVCDPLVAGIPADEPLDASQYAVL
jgi:hypothetical protein